MKLTLLAALSAAATGFLSRPLTHNDKEMDYNKYKHRDTPGMDSMLFGTDVGEIAESSCVHHPTVEWTVETGASIFSTPVISDIWGNGQKQVVSATFAHYVEVVDSDTGEDVPGWPFAHADLSSHASPIVHDLDDDGVAEVIVAATTGHIVVFSADGAVVQQKTLKVPPLAVRRTWHEGLAVEDVMYNDAVRRLEASRAAKHSSKVALAPLSMGDKKGGTPPGAKPHRGASELMRAQLESVTAALPPHADLYNGTVAAEVLRGVFDGADDVSRHRAPQTPGSAKGAHVELLREDFHEGKESARKRAIERAFGRSAEHALRADEAADLTAGAFDAERARAARERYDKMKHGVTDSSLADASGADVLGGPPVAEGRRRVNVVDDGHVSVDDTRQMPRSKRGVDVESVAGGVDAQRRVDDGARGGRGGRGRTAATRRRVLSVREEADEEGVYGEGGVEGEDAGGGEYEDSGDYDYDYASSFVDDEGEPYLGDGWDDDGDDTDLYYAQLAEMNRLDALAESRHEAGVGGLLSKEARVSFDLVFGKGDHHVAGSGKKHGFERKRHTLEPEDDPESPLYLPSWAAKAQTVYAHNASHVFVDAHLLATPVVVDLDRDGALDVVCAVSYYFDHDSSSAPADVDPDNYVAGGIVVLSLNGPPKVVWSVQLDLTTNKAAWRAFIYSGPTVVDLDGDGESEVVVATGMGWVYVFNSTGGLRHGFPVELAAVHGGVAVWDCDMDGILDIVVGDMHGNVVVFSGKDGSEIWDEVLVGGVAAPLQIGDVDGDGLMEVVACTTLGKIYALRVHDGSLLGWFPVSTKGPIYSPPLLISLRETLPPPPLPGRNAFTMSQMWQRIVQLSRDVQPAAVSHHIVVPSHDGRLHIVDGKSRCHDAVDLGEHAYGQVLAGDLRGSGKVDLLLPSMSGNLHLLSTNVSAHPLKSQYADTSGRGVSTASEGVYGVHILTGNNGRRLAMHGSIRLFLHIVDARPRPVTHPRRYVVRVSLGSGNGRVLSDRIVHHPGTYAEVIMTPLQRLHTSLVVTIIDEHGRKASDSIVVDWHTDAHRRFVKFVIAIPFIAACVLLMLVPRDSIGGASLRTTIAPDEDSVAALVQALMLEMEAHGMQPDSSGSETETTSDGSSSEEVT